MAISLIPITALAGSAIDVARVYVVKGRLQQACDAGVLAGRKFMDDSNAGSTLDDTARNRATDFFNNNFRSGWMQTSAVSFVPSKTADSQVSAIAAATVPMTIMRMFGFNQNEVSVTCVARYDVADTDVIFVLDTTGSMACLPSDSTAACNSYVGVAGTSSYTRPSSASAVTGYSGQTGYAVPEKTGSRIAALRQAVVSFYDSFAANADPSTNIRYGFVTYSSSANVGGILKAVDSGSIVGGNGSGTADYQSRRPTGDYAIGLPSAITVSKTQSACVGSIRTPSTPLAYNSSNQASVATLSWSTITKSCTQTTQTYGPKMTYARYSFDVASYVAGQDTADPSNVDGSLTSKWLGCIEERIDPSSAGQSSFSTTSLPADIDPDLQPTSDETRWRPQWPSVEYGRNEAYSYSWGWAYAPGNVSVNGIGLEKSFGDPDRMKSGYSVCGKPATRLKTMSKEDVTNYVTAPDFVAIGGTYHDVGMIWGTRMISPTGFFAADTAPWPNRNAPNRVIVFMTDGDMAPNLQSYSMYGVESMDRRTTGGTGNYSNLTALHNARFLAACSAAKARNIDVWTVAIDSSASTTLQNCATTTSQALYTTSGTGLNDAFKSIAQRLAMLRITK